MEAIVLGTAAAEGIPALFCGCEACRAARATGGREVRARQSLFLPPDILVDLGPDALYAVQRFGLDWSGLKAVLYTHSHADHCAPQELEYVRPVFANNRTAEGLDLYGNEAVQARLTGADDGRPELRFHRVRPFETVPLPGATAVPIRSHHKTDGEETLNYLITRDGKTLLCAWDTGKYDEETWEFLETVRIDAAFVECTFGVKGRNPEWPYHLDLQSAAELVQRLREQGTLAPGAPVALTHFSHNGVRPHEELRELARPHGMDVAYDGMRIGL